MNVRRSAFVWGLLTLISLIGGVWVGVPFFKGASSQEQGEAAGLTALGALGTFSLMKARERRLRQVSLQGERRRERAEVSAEEASDAVRTLELKVAALEKALETALTQSASR